jgi:hypothetical protein
MKRSVAAVAFALILVSGAASGASRHCGTAAFAVGNDLAEPSGIVHIAQLYSLRTKGPVSTSLRTGTLYITTDGRAYYQAETGTVPAAARAAEIAFLEAAGYRALLARQYTHLTDLPAIPAIAGGLAFVRRHGLVATRCT